MTDIARLVVKMEAENAQLLKKVDQTGKRLARWEKSTTRSVDNVKKAFIALGGAVVLKRLITNVTNTIVEFERLRTTLVSVTGSVKNSEVAFARLKEMTAKTPFQLTEITEGFIKLKSFGLDPLDGTYQALIDQSAMLGGDQQTLNGIILAVGQAWAKQKLQGEEILQLIERGVPVWSMLEKALGKNTKEIQKLSEQGKLGRKEIKLLIDEIARTSTGAAERQMDTLGGAFSNLGDASANLADALGEAGLTKVLKGLTAGLNNAATGVTDLVNQLNGRISVDQIDRSIGAISNKMTDLIKQNSYFYERGMKIPPGTIQQLEYLRTELKSLEAQRAALIEQQGIPPESQDGGEGGGEDPISEKIKNDLERLQQSLMTADQLEQSRYERSLEQLRTFRENKAITQEELDALELQLEQQHKDNLTNIEIDYWERIKNAREKSMTELERFSQKSWKSQTNTILGQMAAMTAGVAQGNKLMFNINKAAAASQAILNMHEAVSSAYKWGTVWGGPAGGAAMAAIAAGAQVARIASILGTSFGGGSAAPSVAGTGGGATTVNTVDVTGAATSAPQVSTLTVNLGDFDVAALPETTLRTLLTQIEDARTDMGDATQVIYV